MLSGLNVTPYLSCKYIKRYPELKTILPPFTVTATAAHPAPRPPRAVSTGPSGGVVRRAAPAPLIGCRAGRGQAQTRPFPRKLVRRCCCRALILLFCRRHHGSHARSRVSGCCRRSGCAMRHVWGIAGAKGGLGSVYMWKQKGCCGSSAALVEVGGEAGGCANMSVGNGRDQASAEVRLPLAGPRQGHACGAWGLNS